MTGQSLPQARVVRQRRLRGGRAAVRPAAKRVRWVLKNFDMLVTAAIVLAVLWIASDLQGDNE